MWTFFEKQCILPFVHISCAKAHYKERHMFTRRDPDPAVMIDTTKSNPCARHLPGGDGCLHEIQKGRCACKNSHEPAGCSGRTGAIGVNMEKAMTALRDREVTLANLATFEARHSTGLGLGHLADKRIKQSSPLSGGKP